MKHSCFLTATVVALISLAVVVQDSATLWGATHNQTKLAADSKSIVSPSVDSIKVEMEASQRGRVIVRELSIAAEPGGAVQSLL